MSNRFHRSAFLGLVLSACLGAAQAQVSLSDAWVRSTVPQQKATGFFVRMQSASDMRFVGAASPVAGVVQVHEMAMQDHVMRMRPVPSIALPAGQPVELTPGGYHVMLLDLKQQIKAGEQVPVTLFFEGADGRRQSMELSAPVRALGTGGGAAPDAGHRH
ncbi:MAG: copper chaperone PCu(A)C [Comamonadaceae bacterium]|nr:MAG: copper chaperone PCu(A)C [Comamonadaceae bacterium]